MSNVLVDEGSESASSVLVFFAAVDEERVQNVPVERLNDVLEARDEEVNILVNRVRVDHDLGHKRLPLRRVWLGELPVAIQHITRHVMTELAHSQEQSTGMTVTYLSEREGE